MRRTRYALVLVAGISAAALSCGEDGGGATGPTTGTVSGTVSAGGAGVAGTALTIERAGVTRNTTSSATGTFSFSSLDAGSWTLGITAPAGFELAAGQNASVPVTVTAGQTSTVNVSLEEIVVATASIRANVTADGTAQSGTTVNLYEAGGAASIATMTTNASGDAVFTALVAGGFDVEVVPPTGFALAAGETAKKLVNTTDGAEATVAFALEAASGGSVTEITLSGTSFSSNDVTINAGDKIRWVYQSGGPHTVTPDGHTEWNEVTLDASGETFEHTFNTPGTYEYFCVPHAPGMSGVIRVQ